MKLAQQIHFASRDECLGAYVIVLASASVLAVWTKTLTLAINQKRQNFHISHVYSFHKTFQGVP